jgi:hypothetical protein
MMRIIHQILDLLPGDEFTTGVMKSVKNPKKKILIKTKLKSRKKVVKKVKTKSKIVKAVKKAEKKSKINPKMATLTFVDILIKQKQYTQASNILKIVNNNKSIAKVSITQRQEKIKKGLSKEA